MKAKLRLIVLAVLRFLARRRLKKIKPRIIGITGSKGKTSGKEAIASVLERQFKVKKSKKNLNSEFGVALSILEQNSGYSSFFSWLKILMRSCADAFKRYEAYELLVLEMGVDKPGDMDEILRIITPDIMVFLNVKDEHIDDDQFANKQVIFEEKSKACYAVKTDGWVVLNGDDNFVKQLRGKMPANEIVIGTFEGADLRATNVQTSLKGLSFVLEYEGKAVPVKVPNVMGNCHVYFVLSAIAVGFLQGMPWKAIELELKEFALPPGRMNKIDGKNGAMIIDSSYNASPDSMVEALKVLELFPGRRIAALGTMNELGPLAESAHLKVGKLVAEKADVLIAVGKHAKSYAEGAQRGGMSASMIHVFKNSKEAGEFVSGMIEKHDVILAKGSQNRVRMERLVRACMKNPEQARHLLVRQEPYWLTI